MGPMPGHLHIAPGDKSLEELVGSIERGLWVTRFHYVNVVHPLETIINNAINQVLSRTVVVSLTVILVLIPLTLAGGEVLHDFSLALLLGVIIGTYSSVYVASALALDVWISLDRRKGVQAE